MTKNSLYLLALAALLSPVSAAADPASSGQDYLSLAVGYYNAFDGEDNAADFRAEYRPDYDVWNGVKPWVGGEMTSDASVWVGGGFLYDWEFSPQWILTPSLGAGYYAQGDSDLDLGFPIEFRSQLEVSYEFDTGHRTGVALSHLSNASLDGDNPGTEVLSLYCHQPF